MNFHYTLAAEHFVTQILFRISQNPKEMKRLKYGQFVIPFLQVALAFWMYAKGSYFIAVGFLVVAALWMVFYPKLMQKRYKTSYLAYVQSNYAAALGEKVEVEINNQTIVAKDSKHVSEIPTEDVKEIVQIKEMTMLVLKSGQSVILPETDTSNYSELIPFLQNFAKEKQIPFVEKLDWKWRV